MSDDYITVPVAKGVEDLIPTFMRNRAEEVERLRNALDGHELQKSDASLQPRVYLGDYIRRGNLLDSLVAATIFGASRSFVIAACTFSSTAINFERVKDLLNGSFRPEAVIQA